MPEVPHHITQRGNNRQEVFFSEQHRSRYLDLLRDRCRRYDLRILGWCFMTNHVHIIAVPPTGGSIAAAIGQAHAQYSREVNVSQGRVGHLWQNRFFSSPLDVRHLLIAMLYVDLNPVRAAMVGNALDWRWSSARTHAGVNDSDSLLHPDWRGWMDQARIGWEFDSWRAALESELPSDLVDRIRRGTHRGEPSGDAAFIEEAERVAGRRLRVYRPGRPEKRFETLVAGC